MKMGIFGVGTATLYNKDQRIIATCIDTPNGIAKAFMEMPNAMWVKQAFSENLEPRSKYKSRMCAQNDAKSLLKKEVI